MCFKACCSFIRMSHRSQIPFSSLGGGFYWEGFYVKELVKNSSVTGMPRTKSHESSVSDRSERIQRITTDDDLLKQMKNIGPDHLLVVYFSLPWCGSCQKMNPAVEGLSNKYTEATFFQVNADKCSSSAKKYHVTQVPVCLLFNNRVQVDTIVGASPSELESKIRRNLADIHFQAQGFIPKPQVVNTLSHQQKMVDVTPYMDKIQCRCVNDLAPTPFQSFLEGNKLVSGKGVGRMILFYAFKEKMAITGIKIKAPVLSAPKTLRFFVNLQKVLDFSAISQLSSTQEINLGEDVLSGGQVVELKSGGLVGVQNVQIFIPENMTKNRTIEIDSLILLGAPMSHTPYANADNLTVTNESTNDYEVRNNPGPYAAASSVSQRTKHPSSMRKHNYYSY